MAPTDAVPPLPPSLAWFRPRSDEDSRVFAQDAKRMQLQRGETFFAPARTPEAVYLLEHGLVRIYRLGAGGAEVTLGYVRSGEVFGELAAFGAHPRESYAVAALPSIARQISRAGFAQLMRASPERALGVTRQIVERLKRIERRVVHLVADDARTRLISALLELAHDFGEPDGKRVRLGIRLSQAELATLIGVTRQTVNCVLGELRAEGLISLERGRFVLSQARSHRASLPAYGLLPKGRRGARTS